MERKSRALASFQTSLTDSEFRADHLKLCVLWYDEVLIQTIGQTEDHFYEGLVAQEPDARATIKRLSDVIVPLKKRVDHDLIDRDLRDPHGYPRWGAMHEHYDYPDPQTAEQYAHNRLLRSIEEECGVPRLEGWAVEQAEGRARVATDAVQLWAKVNAEVPCTLQANKDEKLAMGAAHEFATKVALSPLLLFETVVPSLSSVPWREIVTIQRDGRLTSLRNKIREALQAGSQDLNAAVAQFKELEASATEAAIENGRPRVKKIAIESALSNIPGLPVNPYSIFAAIRDTAAAQQRSNELGWFYMLRDIRRSAKQ